MPEERRRLAVYIANRTDLVHYAAGIVGDMAHAEDVVQEAWLRFGDSAPSRALEDPVGYLYRIVRNLAIDSYRGRQRRERLVSSQDLVDHELDIADQAPSPEAAMAAGEEMRLLQEAIAELPARSRRALAMRQFEGASLKEIAAELDLSVSTVHQILAHAIAHSAKRLRQNGARLPSQRRPSQT